MQHTAAHGRADFKVLAKKQADTRSIFIFLRKGVWGEQLRSITFFFFAPHPHRLSAVSETFSGKEGGRS